MGHLEDQGEEAGHQEEEEVGAGLLEEGAGLRVCQGEGVEHLVFQ